MSERGWKLQLIQIFPLWQMLFLHLMMNPHYVKSFSFPPFKSLLFSTTGGILFCLVLRQPEGFWRITTTEIINWTTLFTDMKAELLHCCSTITANLKQCGAFLLHCTASLGNASKEFASYQKNGIKLWVSSVKLNNGIPKPTPGVSSTQHRFLSKLSFQTFFHWNV